MNWVGAAHTAMAPALPLKTALSLAAAAVSLARRCPSATTARRSWWAHQAAPSTLTRRCWWWTLNCQKWQLPHPLQANVALVGCCWVKSQMQQAPTSTWTTPTLSTTPAQCWCLRGVVEWASLCRSRLTSTRGRWVALVVPLTTQLWATTPFCLKTPTCRAADPSKHGDVHQRLPQDACSGPTF